MFHFFTLNLTKYLSIFIKHCIIILWSLNININSVIVNMYDTTQGPLTISLASSLIVKGWGRFISERYSDYLTILDWVLVRRLPNSYLMHRRPIKLLFWLILLWILQWIVWCELRFQGDQTLFWLWHDRLLGERGILGASLKVIIVVLLEIDTTPH